MLNNIILIRNYALGAAMTRKFARGGFGIALLLSATGAANAATITLDKTVTITSTGNDGPVVFDFGAVSAGVASTFGGTIRVQNGAPNAVTIVPLTNGNLGNCPSALASGAICVEVVNFFFVQTASTAPGIYSGQQILNYSFKDAAGATVLDPVTFQWSVNVGAVPVPGPIAGAGLPGLVIALGGLIAWRRRRNQAAVA